MLIVCVGYIRVSVCFFVFVIVVLLLMCCVDGVKSVFFGVLL